MRRFRPKLVAAFTVLLAALAGSPVDARADDTGRATPSAADLAEAAKRFKRGVQLFKEQDFNGALAEFARAHKLAPDYHVLNNIALAHTELKDYPAAVRAYERFLADGGTKIPAARRAAVEDELRKLGTRVARIEVRASVDGAEIKIDDEVVGTSPLPEPLVVAVGRRKITATRSDRTTATQVVELAGGDHASVTLKLTEPEPPKPPPVASTEPAETSSTKPAHDGPSTLHWAGWIGAGTLAVAAGVTGVLTLTAKDEYAEQLATFPGNRATFDRTRSRAQALALTTDILAGTAIALAGVTTYFALWGPSARRQSSSSGARADLLVGPTGVHLNGRF